MSCISTHAHALFCWMFAYDRVGLTLWVTLYDRLLFKYVRSWVPLTGLRSLERTGDFKSRWRYYLKYTIEQIHLALVFWPMRPWTICMSFSVVKFSLYPFKGVGVWLGEELKITFYVFEKTFATLLIRRISDIC